MDKMRSLILSVFFLVFLVFLTGVVSACLEVSVSREAFGAGETFQAQIAVENPVRTLNYDNFFVFENNSEKSAGFYFSRVSYELYFLYFDIPLDWKGNYSFAVRGLCDEGRIKEKRESVNFSILSKSVVISVKPGIVEVDEGESFDVRVVNKGNSTNFKVKSFGDERDFKLFSESFVVVETEVPKSMKEEQYIEFLTVEYSEGFYNIPLIVSPSKISDTSDVQKNDTKEDVQVLVLENITKEDLQEDVEEDEQEDLQEDGQKDVQRVSLLPEGLVFIGEVNEVLRQNETKVMEIGLRNRYQHAIEDIYLLLSSDLNEVVRLEKSKIDRLGANESVVIGIVLNEEGAETGGYLGEIKARNSVSESMQAIVIIRPVQQQGIEDGEDAAEFEDEFGEDLDRGPSKKLGVEEDEEDGERKKRLKIFGYVMIGIGVLVLVLVLISKFRKRPLEGFAGMVEKVENKYLRR